MSNFFLTIGIATCTGWLFKLIDWIEGRPSAIHFIQRIKWSRSEPRRIDF